MKPNGLIALTTLIGSFTLFIPTTQAQQSIPTSAEQFDNGINQGMPNANPKADTDEQGTSSNHDDIDMDNDDDDDDDDDVPDNEDALGSAPSV